MVKLFNKDTGEMLGRVSEAELDFLAAKVEGECLDDRDFYLRKETIEGFRKAGAPLRLVEVLLGGLRDLPAMEVRWERDKE